MRILLDTHALLWFVDASPNLSDQARELIDDPANQRVVSIVIVFKKKKSASNGSATTQGFVDYTNQPN
jgi:PIN domain nuclease of toxin-antitoxin system